MRLLTLICCFSFALLSAHEDPQSQQRLNDMRHDELESTDSLAIPSDSSEMEQEEQLQELKEQERQQQLPNGNHK